MPPTSEKKSPKHFFVRYRHGTLLDVPIAAIADLRKVALLLSQKKDLREQIKEIADGQGGGVAAESTWFQMAHECIEELNRTYHGLREQWRNLIQQYFSIISKDSSTSTIWEELKTFLHQNIDLLSTWKNSPTYMFANEYQVQRQGNEYFYEKGGEKFRIIGARTSLEERADFIANDITHSYGRLNSLLRIFAITCLERTYRQDPTQFPESIKVVLSEDNGGWTSFLHWRWAIDWPYQLRPSKWRPHDNHCDPDWLANDLIAFLSEKESLFVTEGHISKAPELHEKWKRVFGKSKHQTAFALDSNLRLDKEEEAWVEFEGHTYRWINPNESVHPTVVATHAIGEVPDAVELRTFRFLSRVAFQFDHAIEIRFWAGSASSMNRLAVNPQRAGSMQYPSEAIQEIKGKDQKKLNLALSFYREGVTSNSQYYAFLNFYKLLELALGEKSRAIKAWINSEAPKMRAFANLDKNQLTEFRDTEEYLREAGRNALAHVQRGKKKNVIDPDDVKDRKKIQRDLPLVHQLARHAIKSSLF